MDGAKLTLFPSAKETECGGGGNTLPAESTTEDNRQISAAYESTVSAGAAALAEGRTLGVGTYANQAQAPKCPFLCNSV